MDRVEPPAPRRYRGVAAAALLALLTAPGAAAVDFDAGADFAYTRIPVSGRDYKSFGIKLTMSATLSSGLGLEVQGLTGTGDDTIADVEIGVDSTVAAYLRYEYPTNSDLQIYVLAGYAWNSLSISGTGVEDLDDSYNDFSYGIGLQEKLSRWKNWTAVVEFNNYFSDENVDFWSISAGLRYAF